MPARERFAYRLAWLIKKVRRQMYGGIRERLEPIGTSLPTVQIIKRVVTGGALSQLELAQEIELEPAALCRLVAELETGGLVVRRRDPADKRRVLVSATPRGEGLLTDAQPHVMAGINALMARLTTGEQTELCRLLEKLAGDEGAATAPPDPRAAALPVRTRRRVPIARRRTS